MTTGPSLGKLTMGLGWDKKPGAGALSGSNTPDVDLDASAVQYAGDQLFDLAFFNHLETRDGSVVHLGDNISGRGEGDDEQITIDLAKVYPRVDTMLFLVSSYQGHSLEWVDNAYCRLVDEDDVEIARFTLTEGVPRTGFMMAKMFRDGDQLAAGGDRPGHRGHACRPSPWTSSPASSDRSPRAGQFSSAPFG